MIRAKVPFAATPVTSALNSSPTRSFIKIAAATFRILRSTFRAGTFPIVAVFSDILQFIEGILRAFAIDRTLQ
jgi:hypothetical protein